MTKVPFHRRVGLLLMLWLLAPAFHFAAASTAESAAAKPAEALYIGLGQVGLDPNRVYRVRDATLERPAIHITLEDGTIAFTEDVMGRITGAFFEGDGEILLQPPNDVERKSLGLFTGMAIVEERFATAYFRFNDGSADELKPGLRPPDNASEFISKWSATARNLAHSDAMRLLMTFSRRLPVAGHDEVSEGAADASDRMLHARIQGTKLGIFDVFYDSTAGEPVEAGQAKTAADGTTYYDVWTSFAVPQTSRKAPPGSRDPGPQSDEIRKDTFAVRHYAISTDVTPPKRIHSEARLQLDVKQAGQRTLLFELSRFLQVERVEMDGQPIEYIHNPAMEGTELSRRGNDLLAVILPKSVTAGQTMDLRFIYGGEVLAEAGGGLLYVGARGTWYPNRGLAMADFDLTFRYPTEWTLVATGKPVPVSESGGSQMQVSRWTSDRPIPVAGFNLGKYKVMKTRAAGVDIETYAATSVEKSFPVPPPQAFNAHPEVVVSPQGSLQRGLQIVVPHSPSPASNEARVAQAAGQAIEYFAARFGPFPYSRLSLTQMPGRESQGWPGLIFLSSYSFLTNEERAQIHEPPVNILLQQQIPAHETAHQWWGDLVTWSTYRDQWFSEGLANYCSLMMLQEQDPTAFHQIMESYRRDLVQKTKDDDGPLPKDDGPVTLGTRLWSSKFPQGYEAISYGRGTWLFHMLRTMLQDAATVQGNRRTATTPATMKDAEEPFVRALRRVRQRFQGKAITTAQLFDVFAEELPPALRYEGKGSLQWFVDGWVNGTSLPKLELKALKIVAKGQEMMVSGTITQKDAPQDLVTSVPLYAVTGNRPPVLLGRVFADGEESSFRLVAPLGTRKILLDPNQTILTSPK